MSVFLLQFALIVYYKLRQLFYYIFTSSILQITLIISIYVSFITNCVGITNCAFYYKFGQNSSFSLMLTPENFQLIKAHSFKGKVRSERKYECICTCLICNIKFPHLNINFSKLKHLNFRVNSFLWYCLHELSFRVKNYSGNLSYISLSR